MLRKTLLTIDSDNQSRLPAKIDWPLPIEARNFDELIIKLLDIQKISTTELEKTIDQYPMILSVPPRGEPDNQRHLHAISCNLIEIIKSIIRWDKTNSLRYLSQKVANEVAKIPFELHLALSLNVELARPSTGTMFYFSYLDELLAFIENTDIFLRYFRLCAMLRVSAIGESQLDSMAAYKIAAKFGDAADLAFITEWISLQHTAAFQRPLAGITCQSPVSVTVVACHAELLAFDFTRLSSTDISMNVVAIDERLNSQTARRFTTTPLASLELQYRDLRLLVSTTFATIVASLNRESSVDLQAVAKSPEAIAEAQRLAELGLFDISHNGEQGSSHLSYSANFDKRLATLADSRRTVDLTIATNYESLRSLVASVERSEGGKLESKKQFSDALWQSKLVRLLKRDRKLAKLNLFNFLVAEFGLPRDNQAFEEALKRLFEMQYIAITSDWIEYVP